MKISLLQFFLDGHLNGIKLGFHRAKVEEILGRPDVSVPGHSDSEDYAKAGLWYYGGVQFSFTDLEKNVVDDIGFRPFYLLPTSQYRDSKCERRELDLWIFNGECEPKIQDLRNALLREHIGFQDTGLESVVFNEVIENLEVIPYDPTADDSFGTLVLKSGIQVRYLDDGTILRVQIGGEGWMVKGKEQAITV
jgi:hypothetical protein